VDDEQTIITKNVAGLGGRDDFISAADGSFFGHARGNQASKWD
jgi:hypothetical protein